MRPEYKTALAVRNALRASLGPWDPLLADLLRRYRFDSFPTREETLADVQKLHTREGTEKAVSALLVVAYPTLQVEGGDVQLIKWKPNRHRFKGRLEAVFKRMLTENDPVYLYRFSDGTKRKWVYCLKLDERGAKKLIKRG